MNGKILRPRVFSVLARICRARKISLRWNDVDQDDSGDCGFVPNVIVAASRGDVMDAKGIAEGALLVLIVVTGGALLPDLMRYIKICHAKYGRRATDL